MTDAAYWRRQTEALLNRKGFDDAVVESASDDAHACRVDTSELTDDDARRLKMQLNRGGIETTGDGPFVVWTLDEELEYPHAPTDGGEGTSDEE